MSTDLIVGLILPLFAGFFNSSWNLPTKLKLPTSVVPEFAWENFWFLYTFGSIISVIVYTSFVIPFSDLFNVLSPPSTPTSSLVLMIVFSLCWGVGTVLFGLSVLLVGMGMGLTMALAIAILLGTIYPLFLPNLAGNPDTGTTWCLVLFGILIMMGGIFGLGRAGGLQKKGREVLEYELSSTAGDDDDDEDAEQQQVSEERASKFVFEVFEVWNYFGCGRAALGLALRSAFRCARLHGRSLFATLESQWTQLRNFPRNIAASKRTHSMSLARLARS